MGDAAVVIAKTLTHRVAPDENLYPLTWVACFKSCSCPGACGCSAPEWITPQYEVGTVTGTVHQTYTLDLKTEHLKEIHVYPTEEFLKKGMDAWAVHVMRYERGAWIEAWYDGSLSISFAGAAPSKPPVPLTTFTIGQFVAEDAGMWCRIRLFKGNRSLSETFATRPLKDAKFYALEVKG